MANLWDSSSVHIWEKGNRQYKLGNNINECMPGMVTTAAIYNSLGAIVIPENTVLDENIISRLKKLDVGKIDVYIGTESEKSLDSASLFKEKYINNLTLIKEVFQELYSRKSVNMDKVTLITNSVLESDNDNNDIIKNINRIWEIDEYRYTHCLNVCILSMLIAKWLGFNNKRVEMIVKSGLLNDIGNIKVPSEIINKPGPLLSYEFEEIKKHSKYGWQIVSDIPNVENDICMGVLMHHEREDGSGYPDGLQGEEIHEFAKIIGIADVYDAMTTKRVYRKGETPFEVINYMENDGLKKFNQRILLTFLENAANCYKGEKFFLSTGEIGEIIFINPKRYASPIIKIGDSFVDLSQNPSIKLEKLV